MGLLLGVLAYCKSCEDHSPKDWGDIGALVFGFRESVATVMDSISLSLARTESSVPSLYTDTHQPPYASGLTTE